MLLTQHVMNTLDPLARWKLDFPLWELKILPEGASAECLKVFRMCKLDFPL